jgi:hypothetical protein
MWRAIEENLKVESTIVERYPNVPSHSGGQHALPLHLATFGRDPSADRRPSLGTRSNDLATESAGRSRTAPDPAPGSGRYANGWDLAPTIGPAA